MGLTAALQTSISRRARHVAALSGERPGAHTLDTIAECDGRIAGCRALLAFPLVERRDHAIRMLCEGAQMQPVTGNARLTRDAEMELYADAVSGRLPLT